MAKENDVSAFPAQMHEIFFTEHLEIEAEKNGYFLVVYRIGYGEGVAMLGLYKKGANGFLKKVAESQNLKISAPMLMFSKSGFVEIRDKATDSKDIVWKIKIPTMVDLRDPFRETGPSRSVPGK